MFGSTDPLLSNGFEDLMKSQFEMIIMGMINHFLGINIRQTREGIFINQESYTGNLLQHFGMTNWSKPKVLMAVDNPLGPSLDKPAVVLKPYRSMIGSLLYLTASWHDIMSYVCKFVRYQENPREPNFTAMKNIFRYLHGTSNLGLWYLSNIGFFIQAFSDAKLGCCQLDWKNTTGGCQFLDKKLVSWQSEKQTCVWISTTEIEYIVAATCTSQVIWIQS